MSIEPMTAKEYHAGAKIGQRIIAALEEREALLGERAEWLTATGKALNEATELRKRVTELEAERREWSVTAAQQIANVTQEVAPLKADASVGALVRRIREHPMNSKAAPCVIHDHATYGKNFVELDTDGLTKCIAYLDSLLPKEPEVAPSGWTYERADKFVRQIDHEGGTLVVRRADSDAVPPCDREFVAKLMEASRGN